MKNTWGILKLKPFISQLFKLDLLLEFFAMDYNYIKKIFYYYYVEFK